MTDQASEASWKRILGNEIIIRGAKILSDTGPKWEMDFYIRCDNEPDKVHSVFASFEIGDEFVGPCDIASHVESCDSFSGRLNDWMSDHGGELVRHLFVDSTVTPATFLECQNLDVLITLIAITSGFQLRNPRFHSDQERERFLSCLNWAITQALKETRKSVRIL